MIVQFSDIATSKYPRALDPFYQFRRQTTENAQKSEHDLTPNDLIREIDSGFQLVLITELMDESLVLLADHLCWPLVSVASPSLKIQTEKVTPGVPKPLYSKLNATQSYMASPNSRMHRPRI